MDVSVSASQCHSYHCRTGPNKCIACSIEQGVLELTLLIVRKGLDGADVAAFNGCDVDVMMEFMMANSS